MSGSAGVFLYGSCTVCVLYSPTQGFAPSASIGGGGIAVAGVGISAQYSYTNANTFSEVEGEDGVVGGSGKLGIGWGAEYTQDKDNPDIRGFNTGPQIGVDFSPPALPAEVHGGTAKTWVLY